MALPLIPIIIVAGRVAIALAKPAVRIAAKSAVISARAVPVVLRPVGQFTRAAVTGVPRYVKLDKSGAAIINIGVSTRAGMQTHSLIKLSAYGALIRAPKLILKTSIRDGIVTPLYSPLYQAYALARGGRALRGATSKLERIGDKIVLWPAKRLEPYGLAPTLRGDLLSAGRIVLYAKLADGIGELRGATEKLDLYRKVMNAKMESATERVRQLIDSHLPPAPPAPAVIVTQPTLQAPPAPAVIVTPPTLPAPPAPRRILYPALNRR